MNTYFKVRSVTTIVFLVFIFIFSTMNIWYCGKDVLQEIKISIENKLTPRELVTAVDSKINDTIILKNAYIESYGYLQKLMNKNEFSNFDIVKDLDGNMHYTYFATKPNDTSHLSDRTSKFAKEVEERGTKFIYLMTPDKYIPDVTQFPIGIPYSYSNETADNFLQELEDKNIDYIDFRTNLLSSGIDKNKLFYKTDHHWTIETSFWAFTELTRQLNEKYNLNLDKDNFYTDIKNYNCITYPQSFLGSMGRKVGMLYGGIDDFTLIYPKFNTDYIHSSDSKSHKLEFEGRFEESLISSYPFNSEGSLLEVNQDKYFTYLSGNHALTEVTNNNNPDGLKVLFIKDSFMVPTASFFSSMCSKMDLIDPRYFEGDIIEYTKNQDYDFVFLSYYPSNLIDEFFPFFKDEN